MNADVSWFRLEFRGLIDNVRFERQQSDDPRFRDQLHGDTACGLADHRAGERRVLCAGPGARGSYPGLLAASPSDPGIADPEDIKFIQDTALTNLGSRVFSGIDFVVRYDYDLGEWGSVNVGAAGYYQTHRQDPRHSKRSALDDRYQDQDSGNRLQRVRYRLGWANPTWNVTLFANYFGHGAVGQTTKAST